MLPAELPLLVSRRDTYPNQHLEIHVRLYVYRWDSVNELGVPQVSLSVTALTAAPPMCSISLMATGLCAETLWAAQVACCCAGHADCARCHTHVQDQHHTTVTQKPLYVDTLLSPAHF